MTLKQTIQDDLELYKKSVTEKNAFLVNLKQAFAKTESEVTMLTGAIQACEKLLENVENDGKTDRK
jgi:predicted  nucleic acid-binding Zn-ribbon protein